MAVFGSSNRERFLVLVLVTVLCVAEITFANHLAANHLKEKRKAFRAREAAGRVSYSECLVDEGDRKECGYYGIDQAGCASRDCCWAETDNPGTPWCYLSNKLATPECLSVSDHRKDDCGYYGIRTTECLESGCCWNPTADPYTPWCFTPGSSAGGGGGGGGGGGDGGGSGGSGRCGNPAIVPRSMRMSFDDDGSQFTRIVGGSEARPHSWPWQVSFQSDEFHFCGGSLIAPQWVVSAAHCDQRFLEGVTIVLGEHHLFEDTASQVTIPVELTIPHERYGMGANEYDHDIMLIKLREPVTYSDEISPVCLPAQGAQVPEGTVCTVTGWGTTSAGGRSPDQLRQVSVPVLTTETCNQPEWYDGLITDNMVCAGLEEGGKDSCQGDSGGPFVCKEGGQWILHGVVSWGFGCAGPTKPGLYATVANYIEWIEENMEKYS